MLLQPVYKFYLSFITWAQLREAIKCLPGWQYSKTVVGVQTIKANLICIYLTRWLSSVGPVGDTDANPSSGIPGAGATRRVWRVLCAWPEGNTSNSEQRAELNPSRVYLQSKELWAKCK